MFFGVLFVPARCELVMLGIIGNEDACQACNASVGLQHLRLACWYALHDAWVDKK
jgi:hypothetical protein